jgi:Rrf2 family iron-sulfur cluster assembly transcriptional regulator
MGPIEKDIGQLIQFTKTVSIITRLYRFKSLCGNLAMSLSSKSKTAITALVDLAIHQASGPVSLVTIAQRQNISLSSLEQIFGRLRQDGLVTSVRGPGGGYSLCRPAADIHMADVARIFESTQPSDAPMYNHITHELWQNVKQHMFKLLDSVTLQSLVDKAPMPKEHLKPTKPADISRGIARMPVAKPMHLHVANSVFALGNLNRSH